MPKQKRIVPAGYGVRKIETGAYGSCLYPTGKQARGAAEDSLLSTFESNRYEGPIALYAESDVQRLTDLLTRTRSLIADERLHTSEIDKRRRRETKQAHQDRISSNIQENEDRAELLKDIDAALASD